MRNDERTTTNDERVARFYQNEANSPALTNYERTTANDERVARFFQNKANFASGDKRRTNNDERRTL